MTSFAVGDLVECRPFYNSVQGTHMGYVRARVLKTAVSPPKNVRAEAGGHLQVQVDDHDGDKSPAPKTVIVPASWTMAQGQGATVWAKIVSVVERYAAKGEDARKTLREYLGDDSCVVEQLGRALEYMDPKFALPHQDVMTQVLWQQGLLDKLAELILWTKVEVHPELAPYLAPPPHEKHIVSDPEQAQRAAIASVFREYSPFKISSVFEAVASVKGADLTFQERDAIVKATSGLGLSNLCKLEDFYDIVDTVGIVPAARATKPRPKPASSPAPQSVVPKRPRIKKPQESKTGKGKEPAHQGADGADGTEDVLDRVERSMAKIVRLAHDMQIDCREFFESFDRDFDNTVSVEDFITGMSQLGVHDLDAALLKRILARRGLELASGNQVEYRQFLALLAPRKWRRSSTVQDFRANAIAAAALEKLRAVVQTAVAEKKVDLKEAFAHFDTDSNGVIDRKEFSKGLSKLGIALKRSHLRLLMRMFENAADLSGTGISLQAFKDEVLRKRAALLTLQEGASSITSKPEHVLGDKLLLEAAKTLDNAHLSGTNVRDHFESFAVDPTQKTLSLDLFFEGLSTLGFVASDLVPDSTPILETLRTAFAGLENALVGGDNVNYPLVIAQLSPDALLSAAADDANKVIIEATFDNLVDAVAAELERNVTMEDCFAIFDENHNGLLSAPELQKALKSLHIDLDLKRVRLLMKRFIGGAQGFVNQMAFQTAIEDRIKARAQFRGALSYAREEFPKMAQAFAKFDLEQTGKIDVPSALQALSQIKIHYTEEAFLAAVGSKLVTKDKRGKPFIYYQRLLSEVAAGPAKKLWKADHASPQHSTGVHAPSTAQTIASSHPYAPLEGSSSPRIEQKLGEEKRQGPYNFPAGAGDGNMHRIEHLSVVKVHDVIERLRMIVQKATTQGVSMMESFAHFDVNHDGLISSSEFKRGLSRLGFDLDPHERKLLMNEFTAKGTDFIDVAHFFKVLGSPAASASLRIDQVLGDVRALLQARQQRGADNQTCFSFFDKDGRGVIDEAKLEMGLRSLNVRASKLQVRALMKEFGVPHLDGAIDFASFLRMIGVEEERVSIMRIIKRIRLGLAVTHAAHGKAGSGKSAVALTSIKDAFIACDDKRDGVVTLNNFLRTLRNLDLRLPEKDVDKLVGFLDANRDGLIDYDDFVHQVEPPTSTSQLRAAVLAVQAHVARRRLDRHAVTHPFQHFDLGQDGTLTKRDFSCALATLGVRLEGAQLKHLMDALDLEENGKIHYNEFVQVAVPRAQHGLGRSPLSPGASAASPKSPESSLLKTERTMDDPIAYLEADLQEFIASAESMNIPLQETFRYFDRNGDGTVSWDEFHNSLLELGFECSSDQLRQLMARVSGTHWQPASSSARTGTDRADSSRQIIDYNAFLKYWSESRNPAGEPVSKDTRSEGDVMRLVKKLRRELKAFLLESDKRGIKASDIFSHFDLNGDGTISVEEFEMALADIFANHEQFDDRVLRKFTETLDDSKDGQVDYFEFLGIKRSVIPGLTVQEASEAKKQTWQSVFGSRQAEKARRSALAVAQFAIEALLGAVDTEVETQGPIWQAQRRARIARLNNASFIQRNASAVREKVYCARKARVLPRHAAQENISEESLPNPAEISSRSSSSATSAKSMEKRMRLAKRIHVAEMAAARMAEEAALRAEEAAETQRLRNVEAGAIRHALDRIGNVVFLASRERALEFLSSIGLLRFQDRISASVHLGRDRCYVFPLGSDQDMLSVLGTSSTIVARKAKRELLRLLAVDAAPTGDPDPAHWTAGQVSRFATSCGLDAAQLEIMDIDGETLLELDVADALDEIQVRDEVALQALVFRSSYLHFLARAQTGRDVNNDSVDGSAASAPRVFRSLVVNDTMFPRPSEAPIEQWSTGDVVQLMLSLELPTSEARALAVDGITLLELSDEEIANELGIQGHQLSKFRAAIEAVRQPPWFALGTGPYFEARLAAPQANDELAPVHQDNELECTYLRVGREHDIWIHVGPALTEAFQVAQRVLHSGTDEEKSKLVLAHGEAIADERATKALTVSMAEVDLEETRVMEFVRQAARGGLPVLETFKARDDDGDESLTLFRFEEALLALGYECSDLGLLRLTLQSRIRDEERRTSIQYKTFYVKCLNHAEFHHPVFAKASSSQKMAFTADGSMVSLLVESFEQEESLPRDQDAATAAAAAAAAAARLSASRSIRVRYGGGSTMYDATIVCDHQNGSFDVRFEDSGEVQVVPQEWIDFGAAAQGPGAPSSAVTSAASKFQLASCDAQFSSGIHVWRMTVRHLVNDAVLGIASYKAGRRRFVGVDCHGNLVVQGYSAARTRSMQRFARLNKRGFSTNDSVMLRLDLDAQELQLFLAPRPLEAKNSVDDLEELARIRLGEVHQGGNAHSATQSIKAFLRRKRQQLEKLLTRKIEDRQRAVPVSVLSCDLFDLGLEARETDLFAFLQPFMHRRRSGVDPVAMLEGLNLATDRRWEDGSGDDDSDSEIGSGPPRPSLFVPAVLLRGAGDAVQSVEPCRGIAALARAKVGAQVEVRYGGGSTWYEGEIVRVEEHPDGSQPTFQVQYKDGEVESGVRLSNMRILRHEKPPPQAPQSRLIMQLYCRLLAYVVPVSSNQQEDRRSQRRAKRSANPGHLAGAKGRIWQQGRHREVELNAGVLAPTLSVAGPSTRQPHPAESETERPPVFASHVQMRGSTFSDVGGVRTQELLRKRLNTPHPVNWSQTTSVRHQFYAPLAVGQQGRGGRDSAPAAMAGASTSSTEGSAPAVTDAVVSDQSWTLLGSVDVQAMEKVSRGEAGIPVSLRLEAPSDRSYYRVCFMGVLGTVSPSGVFTKIQAPVEPVRAVMNKSRVRIGGGWEHDVFDSLAQSDDAEFSAGRFFLLSGAIVACGSAAERGPALLRQPARPSSATKKKKKTTKTRTEQWQPYERRQPGRTRSRPYREPRPVPVRTVDVQQFEAEDAAQVRDVREEVDAPLPSNSRGRSPEKSRSGSTQRSSPSRTPSKRYRSPPRTCSLQSMFSRDEKVVIDRWLNVVGLNEFGEPPDLVEELTALGRREGRARDRYQNVVVIHPDKPWLDMARERGWLPNREEQRKIRRWARRKGSKRPSMHSMTQTLYEALIAEHPGKPWLERVPRKKPAPVASPTRRDQGAAAVSRAGAVEVGIETRVGTKFRNPAAAVEGPPKASAVNGRRPGPRRLSGRASCIRSWSGDTTL